MTGCPDIREHIREQETSATAADNTYWNTVDTFINKSKTIMLYYGSNHTMSER